MTGSLPASGALTFDMLNTYAGLASGTSVALGGALARLYAGKLSAGSQISASDLYGHGVDYTLSLASPYGDGVYTPPLLLSSYFMASQIPDGNQFFVTGHVVASWNPTNTNPTVTFIKGTAASFNFTRNDRKRYNFTIIYDGADTVKGYGYYSGDSTSFPNGTVYLDEVSLIP